MKNQKELSVSQREELITLLKNRFEKKKTRHQGIERAAVMKKLDANPINFLSTYYFFPIPQAAINNDPNLNQNNNWGGSFDPLQ